MQQLRQKGVISKITVLVLVLLAAAAVLAVLTYRLATRDDIDPALREALDNASCEHLADQELCKFFAVWKAGSGYTASAAAVKDGTEKTYTLKNDGQGFSLSAGGETDYDVVAKDRTVYVREAKGAWYQQTVEAREMDDYREDGGAFNFSEPDSEEAADAYLAKGTEDCGELTCRHYTVESEGGTKDIWFDDKEYRLRRVTVERGNYSYDASVGYEDVSIDTPRESVIVAEGQQIAPGETKPQVLGSDTSDDSGNLPNTGDVIDPEEYRLWLEQRQR